MMDCPELAISKVLAFKLEALEAFDVFADIEMLDACNALISEEVKGGLDV